MNNAYRWTQRTIAAVLNHWTLLLPAKTWEQVSEATPAITVENARQ